MSKPHDCNTAYQAAIRQLVNEPAASAVTVEFVMKTTGLTKYMRVYRNDQIEVLDTLAEAQA